MSNSKKMPYFFNTETQQSIWDVPADLSQDEIQRLPGAHYLKAGSQPTGQVRASHLLVKHSGSRRPASWKEASFIYIYFLARSP